MGIGDFGVDQKGNGYTYNTTSFLADIRMSSLSTSSTNSGTSMGFQLNVVMEITNGSQTYYYWVQDVAVLDSSSKALTFENNIWNFSTSGASLPSGTVVGNGTIYNGGGYSYYAAAASTQSGASITISYPFDLGLRVDTATVSGTPATRFEYSDGYGWQTYDIAHFPWAKGFKDHGYVVDGTQYNPYSLYNDAELDLGGDCCGYDTAASKASLHLSLEFWNGHNYQAVLNPYNHGSDTAEGISNVTSVGKYYASNGTIYGMLTAAGAQSLGRLYDRATMAIVNITTPYQDGIIYFNGTKYGAFVGGEMNLTVGPGTYAIALYENATQIGVENVTVPTGGYVPVYFGAGSKYAVTFSETGLPAGTNWSVSTVGQTRYSTTNQISFAIWNGSWDYRLGLVPGWAPTGRTGQFVVAGGAVAVPTSWSRTTYPVKFTSTGLPTGTDWSVTLNGTTATGPNPTLTFIVPNGSYPFQVGAIPGFVTVDRSGTVTVAGSTLAVSIAWTAFTYPVTFASSGLPSGTGWNITVGGVTVSTRSSTIIVDSPNGTYAYVLGVVPGYREAQGAQGQFTVSANATTVLLTWIHVLYAVALTETGLPTGTTWSANVGGLSVSGPSSTLFVNRSNGTYPLTVAGASGFVPVSYPSQVVVQGGGVVVSVTFGPMTYAYTFAIAGLPTGATWSIDANSGGGWANATGATTILTLDLSNGTWGFRLVLPGGYADGSSSHQVTVAGAAGSVSLVAVPAPGYAAGTVLPATATVTIDGRSVAVVNGAFNVSLSPGVHSLEVTAPGYAPEFDNFTVRSQTTAPFHIALARPASSGGGFSGLFGLDPILVLGLVVLLVIVVLAAVLLRRRPQ